MNNQEIFSQMSVVGGKKHFGRHHSTIAANGEKLICERIEVSQIELSIVIPVFYRFDRLFVLLNCLLSSIQNADIETEVILLDNSLSESGLYDSLQRFFSRKGQRLRVNVKYYHNPFYTHCELRNIGVQLSSPHSSFIGAMDSDVYVSKNTIKMMISCFMAHTEVQALAPPVAPYYGGRHQKARGSFPQIDQHGSQDNLLMPAPYYVEHGRWFTNNLLEMLMLWRIYFVRRNLFDLFPDPQNPWLIDFVAWQNVPLFLTVKEAGKLVCCLLNSDALCLHDERASPHAVSQSMVNWHAETVKSILMLFYRNQLYRTKQQIRNRRFITNMRKILEDIFLRDTKQAIEVMYLIAQIMELEFNQGKQELNKLSVSHSVLRVAVRLMTYSKEIWDRIRKIRSSNLEIPM